MPAPKPIPQQATITLKNGQATTVELNHEHQYTQKTLKIAFRLLKTGWGRSASIKVKTYSKGKAIHETAPIRLKVNEGYKYYLPVALMQAVGSYQLQITTHTTILLKITIN